MPTATRTNPLSFLTDQLDELKAKGTHFKLRVLEDEQAPVCTFDGKRVINLASNNYLGFTTHPKLREAALEAIRKYGVGSGAVRTVAGTMKIHIELEEKIARFKNVESCVVFLSGFAANAGTVSAVLGQDDFIISDQLNHASIIDGARLSRAKILVFNHKDMAHAEQQLASVKDQPGKKLLITDGVFSMDGDIGPLPGLCDAAEKYGAIMMAPYFSAASHRPGSGPMSPSIEKTPSVISSFLPGWSFTLASCSSAWATSLWRKTRICAFDKRAPSMIDAWFSASEMMKSSFPNTAETVPALAANPDWKTTHASTFLKRAIFSSSSMWIFMVPAMVRTAPEPTPYSFVAFSAASRSLGWVVRPR